MAKKKSTKSGSPKKKVINKKAKKSQQELDQEKAQTDGKLIDSKCEEIMALVGNEVDMVSINAVAQAAARLSLTTDIAVSRISEIIQAHIEPCSREMLKKKPKKSRAKK